MKKLIAVVAFLVSVLCFTSCTPNAVPSGSQESIEEQISAQLIGTWEDRYNNRYSTFTFHEDGTVIYTFYADYLSTGKSTARGEYRIEDGQIVYKLTELYNERTQQWDAVSDVSVNSREYTFKNGKLSIDQLEKIKNNIVEW